MKSPLRYPGGKQRYAKHILPHIPADKLLISPFMGGGSVELACMDRGQEVTANDGFPPVANFWFQMIVKPSKVISSVQRAFDCDVKDKYWFSRLRYGALAGDGIESAANYFIVNRSSFSGATLSGGFSESACQSRFTKSSIERLKCVSPILERLRYVHCHDFEEFLENCYPDRFVYADPPYFAVKGLYGKNGDMSFEEDDHARLFNSLQKFDQWAISYNDCPEIRELYHGYEFIELDPSSSMSNGKKKCKEILILKRTNSFDGTVPPP